MRRITIVTIFIMCLLIECNNNFNCANYEDCFSCHDKGCRWTDNKCNFPHHNFKNFEDKFSKLNDCAQYQQSKDLMNKFCGDSSINFEGSSQSISLPRVGESYGRESLLCQYVFKNSHPKNTISATVDITPKYISNAKFVIGATFEDGTSTKRELVLTQNLVRIDNANEITIYYIQSKLFPDLPFVMTLTLEKSKISTTLLITIVLLVFLTVICAVSVYLFSQKIARKNKMNSRQEEQGVLRRGLSNAQVSRVLDQILKEARLKEIENMFKNTIEAIPFNKTVGKYNTSCTICIEEFQEEHIVCVTECLHVFHVECLKKWLITNVMNPKCPNCACCLLKDANVNKKNIEITENNVIHVERQLNDVIQTINANSNNRLNRSAYNDNTNEIFVRENEREVLKDINKIANIKENKTVPLPIMMNRLNQNNRNLSNCTSPHTIEDNNTNQV